MIHDRLTNYQIAESFGDTLSLIYKEKCQEINDDLAVIHHHRYSLMKPQVSEFDRWFFDQTVSGEVKDKLASIDHIRKIRLMYKKIKNSKEEPLDIQKARSVPITSIYDFRFKGKNVSCPFHGKDTHPSASIKYNYFVCFTCSIKLDVIAFFMKINEGIKFKEAIEQLNKL